jgi:hypothetical protein
MDRKDDIITNSIDRIGDNIDRLLEISLEINNLTNNISKTNT